MSACGEILRRDDRDRYLCCLFASARQREALFALYAFNSEVARIRESVRETMLGRIRLQWWRDAIAAIAAGERQAHPVAIGLAVTFRDFDLDPAPFHALLEARERDLDDAPVADMGALTGYAEATGTALMPAVLRVLDHDTVSVRVGADNIAVAWALTGLLCTTPYLARAGRCVLPLDYGLAARDYKALRDHRGLRDTIRAVALQIQYRLDRTSTCRAGGYRRLNPIRLPGRLARLYLQRLERANWNAFDPSINAPMPLKSWALWLASLSRRI